MTEITSRDKFIAIMTALTFDENWREYLHQEMHLFITLIHDYGNDYAKEDETSWFDLIDIFSEQEKDLINVIYDSLLIFY